MEPVGGGVMNDAIRDYFAAIIPVGATGWLHVALGTDPYLDEHGKYQYKRWAPRSFQWPEEGGDAIKWIKESAPLGDVFVCPYLMRDGKRAKGNAIGCQLVHSDVDTGELDPYEVEQLGGFVVASGTIGHGHVYIVLASEVTAAQHELLCRGLAARLGGDSKISDNDLLRPPDTLNHKPAAAGGAPRPVQLVEPYTVAKVKPHVLAARLGVDLSNICRNGQAGASSSQGAEAEPIDLDAYPEVAEELDEVTDPPDRSKDTYRIVAACIDAGLTLAQTRWVVGQRADLAGRLGERRDDDVWRAWQKAQDERARLVQDLTDTAGLAVWPGHSGQLGMAYRLAKAYKGRLLYVYGLGWHYWDDTRYARDDMGMAKQAVYAMLKALWRHAYGNDEKAKELRKAIPRCESSAGIEGILNLAQALPVFAVTVDDLDADPYLLNYANGTLDLRTLELRQHDPADRITKVARAAYDPGATSAVWSAFLEKVLPDKEIREYLQRVVGVSLLGRVVEHNLVILAGKKGRNGKGTLYLALCFALGDYADMASSELFMAHKSAGPSAATPADMALRGLRLVIVSESGRGRTFDEARLKRLTGGDLINARALFQEPVTFRPSHLPLFVTNHLPKACGDDEAVWARLRVVPFDVVIPEQEQDPHLAEKFEAEAEAVLAWAVAGWRDYRERGEKLAEPPGVLVATGKYRTDCDDVGRFLDDEQWILKAPTHKATTAVLRDGYLLWARQEGADEINLREFGRQLDDRGFPVTDRTKTGRFRDGLAPHPLMYTAGVGWGPQR